MRFLRRLFTLQAAAVLTGFAVLVKGAIAAQPHALLIGLALMLAAGQVRQGLRHRERMHELRAATAPHPQLQARMEALEKSVTSLTNAVGSGSAWK